MWEVPTTISIKDYTVMTYPVIEWKEIIPSRYCLTISEYRHLGKGLKINNTLYL